MADPWTAQQFVDDLRARTVGLTGDITLQLAETSKGLLESYGVTGQPASDHRAQAMGLLGMTLAGGSIL